MRKQRIIPGDNLVSSNAGCIKYRKRKNSAVPATTVFWLYLTQPTVVMFDNNNNNNNNARITYQF